MVSTRRISVCQYSHLVDNEKCLKANKPKLVLTGNVSLIALFLSLYNLKVIFFFQKMMNENEQIKECQRKNSFYTFIYEAFLH